MAGALAVGISMHRMNRQEHEGKPIRRRREGQGASQEKEDPYDSA
ncbi:hypothetical protein KNP414_02221 [Paenibacillus mucilaginosus KNP414]|uniref:Uncharacterized protein n=1 Tax=Paenibacillus mucilaginosus (strain KNP414) TaxID=1036673 RepID=F8F552_PAEMK|nr:hypothetical protein KNP414_02221 [Paenibacillus mucilaginosus KNP414]